MRRFVPSHSTGESVCPPASNGLSSSLSRPGMTVTPQRSTNKPASSSYKDRSSVLSHHIPTRSSAAQMDEPEGVLKHPSEDSASLASSLAEPINLEDSHYASLRGNLEFDAQNLEAESWSLAVDQNYLISLSKGAVKRQDVIYELIQTEMHHVRTLKILLHIYMHELNQSTLVDKAWMERLFPGVEVLLSLHQHFFSALKERRNQSQEEGCSNNYYITQLGDILINQFSGTLGEQMIGAYSHFCSHHSEAVSFYKEQIQNNKKLQILIRKIDQVPLVRRLGIPECFLLVTQRITKYPVLVERIIENTEADTEDYKYLVKGLELIKDTISQVNTQVCEYEKGARLREISLRLESKTPARLKDGQLFRREDLIQGNRVLLHEATVTWKSSTKQKDILAVLLSDVLLLLQEKDHKLVFASMDNKSPVISLQRVIVREVANEDKGLYLICACTSSLAEMYELHAGSKEECQRWMSLIRGAVDSFQEKVQYNKVIATLQRFQDLLQERDNQIQHSLMEKQQIFAALYEYVTGQKPAHNELLRGDAADHQQGATLLNEAIEEVEKLQNLFMRISDAHPPTEETETQGDQVMCAQTFQTTSSRTYGDAAETPDRRVDSSQTSFEHLIKKMSLSDGLELFADDKINTSSHFPEREVSDLVWKVAERLNSLKAVIAQQDSRIELQKAFQMKSKQPARNYTNALLEQEKQRNLEKQKEELANLHKQQAQHREQQHRWEKERERQRVQMEVLEAALKQREEECRLREEKLTEEKMELEKQWGNYQQDLHRLREATKTVDRDKERLRQEKERLDKWMMKISQDSKYDDPAQSLSLSTFPSIRGSAVNGGGALNSAQNPRVLSDNRSDPIECPPRVPPRRESISPRPTKQKLPEHLISTTNQVQKPPVQQLIPPKLASASKRKEKGPKGKSHKRTHSAANIDVSQVVPIRATGNAGGSLKAISNTTFKRNLNPDTFKPPGPAQNPKPSQSFSTNRRDSSEDPPPPPPPYPKDLLKNKKEKELIV